MDYIRKNGNQLKPHTITVHLEKKDDFLSLASTKERDHIWYSDEPKERGGQDKGANPLSYFLSGMGFCQLVHYAEHSIADHIKIDSIDMKIEGIISLQWPRRFTEVTYEVKISSSENDEKILKLARTAAQDCFVTNTLKRACKVLGIIIHNGHKIDTQI